MITVFGSINMDLVAIASKMPRPGETVVGLQSSASPGGKGANQAVAARRAGAGVRMAGAIGQDPFGAEALALLKDASVDLSPVRAVKQPTGSAHVVVDAGGENAIVVVPGANGQVEEDDARSVLEGMNAGEMVVLQMEIPPCAVEAARVCLVTPPQIIDCLEFNRSMRIIDPYDEIGYVALECEVLGADWIRPLLLSALERELGDRPDDPLLALYGRFRALLRARLCLVHLLEHPVRESKKWRPLALAYLTQARRHPSVIAA